MTTEDIILHIFYLVATSLPVLPRHAQAKLYPSELVTIGILFALKGGYFRAFYRWLERDYGDWFGDGILPERTRLQRLLKTHQDWCDLLLCNPTFFTVIDSYPIELLFPIREGRTEHQIGKKGRDKGRWSIGIKLCWLLNDVGRVVNWDWSTMNVSDKHFHPVVEPFIGQTIVLADFGFRDKEGVPHDFRPDAVMRLDAKLHRCSVLSPAKPRPMSTAPASPKRLQWTPRWRLPVQLTTLK